VIVGDKQDKDGKILDGLFRFYQDPHVYPFTWPNFELIQRNILIRIEQYGSTTSQELTENLGEEISLLSSLINSNKPKTWISKANVSNSCKNYENLTSQLQLEEDNICSKLCTEKNRLKILRLFVRIKSKA